MAESGASLVADIGYVDSFDGGDYGNPPNFNWNSIFGERCSDLGFGGGGV